MSIADHAEETIQGPPRPGGDDPSREDPQLQEHQELRCRARPVHDPGGQERGGEVATSWMRCDSSGRRVDATRRASFSRSSGVFSRSRSPWGGAKPEAVYPLSDSEIHAGLRPWMKADRGVLPRSGPCQEAGDESGFVGDLGTKALGPIRDSRGRARAFIPPLTTVVNGSMNRRCR